MTGLDPWGGNEILERDTARNLHNHCGFIKEFLTWMRRQFGQVVVKGLPDHQKLRVKKKRAELCRRFGINLKESTKIMKESKP